MKNRQDNAPRRSVFREFLDELKLGDKLLPTRNASISWVWVFFPACIGYLIILSQILNTKPTLGSIEIVSESNFGKLARINYPIEVLSTGGAWTEGPLWVDDDSSMQYLLYSDVIQNKIYKWEEGRGFFTIGKTLYLTKSGCKQDDMSAYCDTLYMPGTNGLTRMFPTSDDGSLEMIMCQHGERAITLQRDNGTRTEIATHYKGKRFNSPNDLIWSPEGHLYFTDPAYGLYRKGGPTHEDSTGASGRYLDDKLQEQSISGLYMIHRNEIVKAIELGKPAENVFLIDSKVSHPNGLAFSPGFSKLYISNSDPNNAYWKVYDVNSNGLAHKGKVFYNATAQLGAYDYGNPDGLKVDISGNIYASGPNGVLILSPEGQLIGRLHTDRPVSNVAWGDRGYLYMTAEDLVLRKRFNTKPPKPLVFKKK